MRYHLPGGVAAVLALRPEWPLPLRTELAPRALPRLAPVPQATVLAHLSDDAEPRLAPLVRERIHHPHPAVRLAALRALATVGNATAIAALVQTVSQGAKPERAAAHRSLIHLAGFKVADALVDQQIRASPDSQAKILNTPSARHKTRAVSHLTELLRTGAAPARLTALRALVELAGRESFGPFLRLVSELQDLESKRQLVDFHRWLERLASQPLDTAPLAEALDTATDANRAALFEIAARLPEQQIRTAIQRALKSTEPTQRQAALQTLCQTQDPELLPDILQQSEKAGDPRLQALRVRRALAGRSAAERTAKRWPTCGPIALSQPGRDYPFQALVFVGTDLVPPSRDAGPGGTNPATRSGRARRG